MKTVSIVISFMIVIATILYGFELISNNNICTSVRAFTCNK